METEFARLMSTIWESERALDALYSKAADLKKLLRNPENTHSNASVFPIEVLGMIFEEAVEQSNACMKHQPSLLKPDRLPQEPHAVVRPELLVSHVSKYWRAVAIGTPSLWTRIHLYVKQSADLIDLYLTRSRGLPLSVIFRQHFVCGANPHQYYAADYMRIAATILNHMHICRRLEIRTNIPIPELLEGLGCSRAPLLEEIVIYHPRMQEPVFSSSSFPALAHLELGELISISATIPNKDLTSLTLSGLPALGLPVASFLNLLRGLPSLSRLALLDEAVNFDGLHTTDVVQLPSLRSLSLRPGPDVSRIYLTGLMETVITPVLEELVLDFTNVSSSRELRLFLWHLERVAPRFLSLRHITINCPFEAFDIVNALVYAAPNIETLSLSRYNVSSVLTYLMHDARREAFPRLRALQFESPQWDWDVVLSFLHKRKNFGRPLHRLQFDGFGGSKGEVLDNVFRNLLEACLAI